MSSVSGSVTARERRHLPVPCGGRRIRPLLSRFDWLQTFALRAARVCMALEMRRR